MNLHIERLRSDRLWRIGLALAIAGLVLRLYAPALRWGFWFDDPALHLVSVESRSAAELLRPAEPFGYYRPTGLLFLWAMMRIWGGFSPLPFHGALLAIHLANAALIYQLLHRASRSEQFAGLSAAFFALHPLAPEAVAYFGGFFHPLALLLLLAGGWLHWVAVRRRSGIALAACAAALGLAAGAHEIAVAAAPMVLLLPYATGHARGPLWRPRAWAPLLGPLAYVLARFLSMTDGQGLAVFGEFVPKAATMAQALLAPAVVALGGLAGQLPILIAAVGVFVAGSGWLVRRPPRRYLWLWGLGWYAVTILPILLFLEADYVVHGPRLAYVPAVGIAIAWAAPLTALIESTARRPLRKRALRLVGHLLSAGVLLASVAPVRQQVRLYSHTNAIVQGMATLARGAAPDRELVWVNLPYWWAPEHLDADLRPALPWLRWAQIVLPPYGNAALLARANGGPDRPMREISFAGYAHLGGTAGDQVSPLRLRALAKTQQVYALDLPSATFHDVTAEWQALAGTGQAEASPWVAPLLAPPELARPDELAAARQHGARWDALVLEAVALDSSQLPGNDLAVALFWRPEGPAALEGMDGSLRLMDRYGQLLVEQRFPLLAGYGPDLWEPDVIYATRINVPVPPNAALGPARLELGLTRGAEFVVPTECVTCDPAGWALVGETLIGREQVVAEMDAGANRLDAIWENGMRLEGWLLTEPSAAGEAGTRKRGG